MIENSSIPKLNVNKTLVKYQSFSIDVSKEILIAYLINGYSHRRIDREVLGLDDSKTHGFKSMGALHNFGIDVSFKGIFNEYTPLEIVDILGKDDSFYEICEILKWEKNVELPPLVKSKRKTEFNRYSQAEIREVIVQYLVEGKTHRQIDADVLLLNPRKSKGFQSFSILNYLGLNGPFKGLAKEVGLEAITDAFIKSNNDYNEILNIIQPTICEKQNMPSSKASGVYVSSTFDEDFIELKITDYSLHGGRKNRL